MLKFISIMIKINRPPEALPADAVHPAPGILPIKVNIDTDMG